MLIFIHILSQLPRFIHSHYRQHRWDVDTALEKVPSVSTKWHVISYPLRSPLHTGHRFTARTGQDVGCFPELFQT